MTDSIVFIIHSRGIPRHEIASPLIGLRFYDNIEHWRIDEVLDMLKDTIDPNLIGNAKQIKNYH